ncbi:phospholipid carrier-dependent glycosyltransferase [Spongiactinospora gelatinilytica]|uniref:phospholipid carrier-dependent glycosyltransferase n=1 Tax=Spongiactinospora gelatinilytica TaxID=2666298 RepID=UPI0011B948CE|nr:phospholipid carrier-dependent glycosyltransferase [Spongiactinospora gelatinilytica]
MRYASLAITTTLRQHRLFVGATVFAIWLRIITTLGFRPAWVYWFDSFTYLNAAMQFRPESGWQPGGYPLFLWLLWPFHSVTVVVIVQHALGLTIGLLIYAMLRRRGARPWIAVMATVPVFFDASYLRLEHAVLSDTLFIFLLTLAVTTALWHPDVTIKAAVLAGTFLACASVVRTIGLGLIPLFLLWLLVRRGGWKRALAMAVAAAIPLLAHGAWYAHNYGSFSLLAGGNSGVLLWARTMTFADCTRIRPPDDERRLCPNSAVQDAASEYVWDPHSAINRYSGPSKNELALSFAIRAIATQPLDYILHIIKDTSIAFAWTPIAHPKRVTPAYGFAEGSWPIPQNPLLDDVREKYDNSIGVLRSVDPYASFVVRYQYVAYMHGPLKAAIFLLGAYGLIRRRKDVTIAWFMAAFLLVGPVAVLDFDHRYVLPAIPIACIAAALATISPRDRPRCDPLPQAHRLTVEVDEARPGLD